MVHVLGAVVGSEREVPLYTLNVAMGETKKADLKVWPGQEPADAVAGFSFDHYERTDGRKQDAERSMLDHLCERLPCGRREGRPVLFPLDVDLPGGGGKARLHVHEGDDEDVVAFASTAARRHGFLGASLEKQLVDVVRGEIERRAAGQQKGAIFSTFKAHISASFHSFQLIFGRVIISPQVLVR